MNNANTPNWKAYWIWHKGEPDKPNRYVYFRRCFSVKNPFEKVRCYISADTSYKLFVNGKFVGNGPVLTEPRWQSYDSYDISNFILQGENVVGAIVFHHGNGIGNPDGLTLNWSRGGFLCQIDLEHKVKDVESIITDSSWDVLESSAWNKDAPMMDRMAFAEMYDAGKEPKGWLESGFSDKEWVPAAVITIDQSVKQWVRNSAPSEVLPWIQLEPRPIPYFERHQMIPKAIVNAGEVLEMAETNQKDVAVRMSLEQINPFHHVAIENIETLIGAGHKPVIVRPMDDDVSYDDFAGVYDPVIVLDTGKLINGRVFLDIETHEGVVIDIGYGQILVDNRVIPYLSNRTLMADQYITKDGRQSFETFNWRHFRYVQLTFRKMNKPVKIHKIKMISESYPVERRGHFECNDEMLNWIWKACVETSHLCTYDRFMDNPFRERREYTGDVLNILHGIYAGFGDLDIIRKYFIDIKRGQLSYGMFSTAVLGQRREHNRIFLTGGLFLLRLWEYYELFGKKEILDEMFQSILSFIKHIEGFTDETGLIRKVPYPVFIDWSDIDLNGQNICLNAVFAQAMKSLSNIADVLGEQVLSAEYKQKSQRLFNLISRLFWNEEKGVFVDALTDGVQSEHISEHGNFLMILFGCASSKLNQRILKYLSGPSLCIGRLEPLYYWASEALFKIYEGKQAVDMMKQRYGKMRKQGLDTISELWNLFGERYEGRWRSRDSRSAVQSGGVSPAYLLSKYALGISPLKPGFQDVLIAPQLCALKWAKGTWPSPKGDIHVDWKNDGNTFAIECSLPLHTKGHLVLPPEVLPANAIEVNGKEIEVKVETIQISDNTKIEIAY